MRGLGEQLQERVLAEAGEARDAHAQVVEDLPSPVTRFLEGGGVSLTLDRVFKTLLDSTQGV